MNFEYRVVKKTSGFYIKKVENNKDGTFTDFGSSCIFGTTYQELIHDLAHIKEAFSRPTLIDSKVDNNLIEETNENKE